MNEALTKLIASIALISAGAGGMALIKNKQPVEGRPLPSEIPIIQVTKDSFQRLKAFQESLPKSNVQVRPINIQGLQRSNADLLRMIKHD